MYDCPLLESPPIFSRTFCLTCTWRKFIQLKLRLYAIYTKKDQWITGSGLLRRLFFCGCRDAESSNLFDCSLLFRLIRLASLVQTAAITFISTFIHQLLFYSSYFFHVSLNICYGCLSWKSSPFSVTSTNSGYPSFYCILLLTTSCTRSHTTLTFLLSASATYRTILINRFLFHQELCIGSNVSSVSSFCPCSFSTSITSLFYFHLSIAICVHTNRRNLSPVWGKIWINKSTLAKVGA